MRAQKSQTKATKPADERGETVSKSETSKTRKPTDAITLTTIFPSYRAQEYSTRLADQRKAFIEELQQAYLNRGLVLYVGAGVSRSMDLPAWFDLVRTLTVTMMSRKVESAIQNLGSLDEENYWEKTHTIYEELEKGSDRNKPILMMTRALKDQLGSDLPMAVARILYRPIRHRANSRWLRVRGQEDEEYIREMLPSSPLVEAIIALARSERDVKGVQAIVNYNYDDILDELLKANRVRCMTVRSGHDRLPYGTLPCYHVHGVLPIREFLARGHLRPGVDSNIGNFVFSEDEYHAEYASPFKWSNMTQMSLLGRYTGLFVGLSMEDPNIRRLIDATHQQYPDIVNYAIIPRQASKEQKGSSKEAVLRNLFEEVETGSFDKIGVRVIWVNEYPEVPQVIEQICQLDVASIHAQSSRSGGAAKPPTLPGQQWTTAPAETAEAQNT